MKALYRIATLSFGLALVGCASTQTARIAPPAVPGAVVMDDRYVSMVDNIAKQRGTVVVWINPPKKQVPVVAVVE